MLTIKQVFNSEIPKNAKIKLFGKDCLLLGVNFTEGKTYSVEVPADVGEGNINVPVSAEHEVLINVKPKSAEEIEKEKTLAEAKLKEEKEAEAKRVREESEKGVHTPPVGGLHVKPTPEPTVPLANPIKSGATQ